MNLKDIRIFLEKKVDEYNQPSFISNDPVSIPHSFSKKADMEIAGFFAAVFAWGNRTIIINKSRELMQLMDNAPYEFITQHQPHHLKKLLLFKHRTFNTTDLLYFIEFLNHHYSRERSLETAFLPGGQFTDIESSLNHFHRYFFSLPDAPHRTVKHIAAPFRNSTCKRLNMFLRWMVRYDNRGVDFGIWRQVKQDALVCPVDLHVARVGRKLGLIKRKATDWQTALELTATLRKFDKHDPAKYDFALFSLGIEEKF